MPADPLLFQRVQAISDQLRAACSEYAARMLSAQKLPPDVSVPPDWIEALGFATFAAAHEAAEDFLDYLLESRHAH